jgi:LacI family transcriptional regulator
MSNIQQIALECGVSIATVSRVFNNYSNVRENIRRKVIEKSRELGYEPKNNSKKKHVAIIIPSDKRIVFHSYLGAILSEVYVQIKKRAYSSELILLKDIAQLNSKPLYGAISIMFTKGLEKEWGKKFNVPMVSLNSEAQHLDDIFTVAANEEQGINTAVNYLKEAGHSKIGFLSSGTPGNWCNARRVSGFRKALKRHMLSIENCPHMHANSLGTIYEPLGLLLKKRITALICSGENLSVPVAYALNLYEKSVPEDISLIAWENPSVSEFCIPSQTTVAQNFSLMASTAFDILKNWHNDHREPIKDALVDYTLIERHSVKRLK